MTARERFVQLISAPAASRLPLSYVLESFDIVAKEFPSLGEVHIPTVEELAAKAAEANVSAAAAEEWAQMQAVIIADRQKKKEAGVAPRQDNLKEWKVEAE